MKYLLHFHRVSTHDEVGEQGKRVCERLTAVSRHGAPWSAVRHANIYLPGIALKVYVSRPDVLR
jgi:hypothetical protein